MKQGHRTIGGEHETPNSERIEVLESDVHVPDDQKSLKAPSALFWTCRNQIYDFKRCSLKTRSH